MAGIGRYSQIIGSSTRNFKPGTTLVPPIVRKVGFGTVVNPQGKHINFSQPPRGAIVGVTTVRPNPAYMGAQLHDYGLRQAKAPGALYTQQFIKKLSVDLTNTFTDVLYFVSGTIFWYMTSTNTTDQLQVRIGDVTADQLPFGPGNGIEGLSFNKVYLTNNTATPGATAVLVYFTDDPNAPARFF